MLRTEAFGKCMLLRNGQARMTWCRAYSDYTDRTKVWARLHFKALRAPSTVTAPSALRHPLQSFTPLSPALMSAMYTIRCCEITIYECNSAKDTQRKAKLEKRRIVTQVSKKREQNGICVTHPPRLTNVSDDLVVGISAELCGWFRRNGRTCKNHYPMRFSAEKTETNSQRLFYPSSLH